ncbi:MAG: hypothetical protein WC277_05410 [Bacilli bacterium]|jgi:hypothetical protein
MPIYDVTLDAEVSARVRGTLRVEAPDARTAEQTARARLTDRDLTDLREITCRESIAVAGVRDVAPPEDKPGRCGCVPLDLYLDPSLLVQRLSNQEFQDLLCDQSARGDLAECRRLKAIRARRPVGVKVRHLLEGLCGGR